MASFVRLVTGRGRHTDDVTVRGQAYAAFVRSPHALAWLGVEHVEMPATPERVWRAIQDAKARA